ncbi:MULTISPECIES: hypothetical protein [Pseudomonas]|uniref:hypothetical protein n=1 Tax=Pseudomonas TaxID=286 RepID=UPI000BA41B74|nr:MULTISPECIES: hypothetical protein [Pseudomonas]MDR9860675.1 hypothetical protein [Pseudomonas baetica]
MKLNEGANKQPVTEAEMSKYLKPGDEVSFGDGRGNARVISKTLISEGEDWKLKLILMDLADGKPRPVETAPSSLSEIAKYLTKGDLVIHPSGTGRVSHIMFQANDEGKFDPIIMLDER